VLHYEGRTHSKVILRIFLYFFLIFLIFLILFDETLILASRFTFFRSKTPIMKAGHHLDTIRRYAFEILFKKFFFINFIYETLILMFRLIFLKSKVPITKPDIFEGNAFEFFLYLYFFIILFNETR
jgi:hypothetical protein